MNKKTGFSKNTLAIVILGLITIICWISLSVYSALHKSNLSPLLKQQLTPLNPEFDQPTLESLKKRKTISSQELEEAPEITQLNLPKNTATPAASPQP